MVLPAGMPLSVTVNGSVLRCRCAEDASVATGDDEVAVQRRIKERREPVLGRRCMAWENDVDCQEETGTDETPEKTRHA
jgi:hypothetical protein